ncbi:aspartyl protease family protein [Sphingomonas sp. WKB10]|nr:aspartyl protease family protein [Sphingomonas sp. WKB10]
MKQDKNGVCSLARSAMTGAVLSVPFRVVDGRIYVTVKVDGKGPFVFAVDTGASGMGRADAGLVAALAMPLSGSGHTSDGVATAEVRTVRLASVALGGFVRRDPRGRHP